MRRIFLISVLCIRFVPTLPTPAKAPPCQLPPFTNLLPLNSRRELRKIWAGFHSTTAAKKCERQLAQTRELIAGLPEDVKIRILDFDRGIVTPVETSHKNNNFLSGLSEEQTHQFSQIMSNRSATSEQKYDMLRNWASEYLDLDQISKVDQFISFLQRKDKSFQAKVKNLSSEARIAHDKLESLRRLKQDVYNELSDKAKKELALLYRAKCPRGSIYESSDLDAEEIQLACSVDERMPLLRTIPTNSHSSSTTPSTIVTTKLPTETTTTSTTPSTTTTTPATTTSTPTTTTTVTTTSTTTTTPSTTTATTKIPSTTKSHSSPDQKSYSTNKSPNNEQESLWVRLTTPETTTHGRLSFEIERSNSSIPVIPGRPNGVASMFVADPEKLSDLLKKIFKQN
ncbi:unnamed protein product [Caenorhabditis bovis]|uniref:SXP/RAL-2 family protein Ani s 5-like cation-binding domain-containing protein n=1 Tax=Caenorhabditis bovis TaxID=2654633 RepID=A0A8S1EVK3_9PELO|nr:unnamed protein product [Caenorhabditis bovis]